MSLTEALLLLISIKLTGILVFVIGIYWKLK